MYDYLHFYPFREKILQNKVHIHQHRVQNRICGTVNLDDYSIRTSYTLILLFNREFSK